MKWKKKMRTHWFGLNNNLNQKLFYLQLNHQKRFLMIYLDMEMTTEGISVRKIDFKVTSN